ncbi:hypothetical protein Aut01nite_65610 [Actinoplanes utahensis]|nr:hypothetical protein Aut01nite_65610 [Actinoplanes utahensis]
MTGRHHGLVEQRPATRTPFVVSAPRVEVTIRSSDFAFTVMSGDAANGGRLAEFLPRASVLQRARLVGAGVADAEWIGQAREKLSPQCPLPL